MSVIFILIGCSILIALGFLIGFIWAVKNGQFDDTFTPAFRVLFDEQHKNQENKENEEVF